MILAKNQFVESKIKTRPLKIITLCLLFVLLIGINNTYIYNTGLKPFGISLIFALLFIDFNGYILAITYSLSNILVALSIDSIITSVFVGGVLIFIEFIRSKGRLTKIKKIPLCLLALLSMFGYIVVNISNDAKNNLALLVSVLLGLFFLISCTYYLDATIGRGMLTKINLDEKICGCSILIVFSIGISNIYISILSLGLVISTIIIQIVTKLHGASISIVCGVLIGLGYSIFNFNPIYISMFALLSLATLAFKCNIRALSVVAYIISYILFCLFFNLGLSVGEIVSVGIGGLIYILIPSKIIKSVSEIFIVSRQVAVYDIFNSTKTELVNRVKDLGAIFEEMNSVYRNMVKGNLPDEKAKEMMREEVLSGVCDGCTNKDRCFRMTGSFMDNCFDTIIDLGYEKGKLLLVDLPEYFTTNCIKISNIMQYYNNLLSAYVDYRTSVSNIDTSRVLIADQLSGVSKLLEALSLEIDINVSFNKELEETIKERLAYAGIDCIECVVYEKTIQDKTINLIVRNKMVNVNKIENIVNKLTKSRFKTSKIQDSNIIGTISILLSSMPKYDIAFGSSSITKSGKVISGDNHSVISIGDGKYIVSICDGMGSGKEANSISKLTLSLIENFYRAGFENDIILSSVNKLLSLNESENFSTIDLCAIDCKKSFYDFVKLGASNGYILRDSGEVEVVSSSGLPIGVLEEIRPHITKLFIRSMDIVVLISDGIADVLGDSISNIIRNSQIVNPQGLADYIMTQALEHSGGVPIDDMTVVCVRVFENV